MRFDKEDNQGRDTSVCDRSREDAFDCAMGAYEAPDEARNVGAEQTKRYDRGKELDEADDLKDTGVQRVGTDGFRDEIHRVILVWSRWDEKFRLMLLGRG